MMDILRKEVYSRSGIVVAEVSDASSDLNGQRNNTDIPLARKRLLK